MSIVSGYLVQAFGWRWMFVIEGVPSTLWAFAWWYLADDKPSQAKWLPAADQQAIERTIAAEQAGVKNVRNLGEAFRAPAVVIMATLYFFWGLALFGFVLWLPTIIKQAGSSMVATGWLSSFPYLVATILMPTLSIVSDRIGDRRSVVLPCIAISGLAYLALYFGGQTQGMLAYLILCVAGIGPIVALPLFFSIPADILPKSVAGGAVALINAMGALGGFLGTYLVGWLNGLTNNPASSFLLMGGSLVLAAIMLMTLPRKA
jgi:MFS family permease